MKAFRRLGFALWLALALLVGQHAVALHELVHVAEKLSQKQDSKPAPAKCGECFAGAQLAGGAPAALVVVAVLDVEAVRGFHRIPSQRPAPAVPYLSRGPPELS